MTSPTTGRALTDALSERVNSALPGYTTALQVIEQHIDNKEADLAEACAELEKAKARIAELAVVIGQQRLALEETHIALGIAAGRGRMAPPPPLPARDAFEESVIKEMMNPNCRHCAALAGALELVESALCKDSTPKFVIGDSVEYRIDGQAMGQAINAARTALSNYRQAMGREG